MQEFVFLPESSTTGRADTRLSTKMLSALMMGVSGWIKAMSWYVPMPSSPRVCFMKAGFGISHIWGRRGKKKTTHPHTHNEIPFIKVKAYLINFHTDHKGAADNESRRRDGVSSSSNHKHQFYFF